MADAVASNGRAESLIGTWTRDGGDRCSEPYPATLSFAANGLYRGASELPGGFTVWDVGTWQVETPGRVAISTANDAVVNYSFAFADGGVSFTAPDGCRFGYRKAE